MYLNHCAVHLKLTQHYKSTILQKSFFLEKQSHTTGDFCIEWHSSREKKAEGPVVKTSPSSPESAGLISGQGTKIPHTICLVVKKTKHKTEAIL